ncbi:MAG: RHS repeat-associated core domain-containing protein, partial [Brevundimonas sp.]
TVSWLHTDHQGSVVATSNAAGAPVSLVNYSPSGELGTALDGTALTAPPTGSPFGYTGRQYDAETGLWQYRARYYHPQLGQFLSQDPIGTKDDPNLYLYVANDPMNRTDPTGMREVRWSVQPSAAGAFARQLVRYLGTSEGRSQYVALNQSSKIYTINAGVGLGNEYVWETREINWDPTESGPLDDGSSQSSAVVLGHEVSHALSHDRQGTKAFREGLRDQTPPTMTEDENGDFVVSRGAPSIEEERAVDDADRIAKELGEPLRERYRNDGIRPR